MTNNNNTKSGWIVRFLNLPSQQQINFLYRYSLQKNIREEIEKEVYGYSKGG